MDAWLIARATAIAAPMIADFEGLYLTPYLCPAGVPTIGHGSTAYLDGRKVKLTDPAITVDEARELLAESIRCTYLPGVLRLCPGVDTPGRLAALISFAYNLGLGALQSSTLRKRVNAGRWEDVPYELRRWVKAGGRVLRGLVRRREAECRLI